MRDCNQGRFMTFNGTGRLKLVLVAVLALFIVTEWLESAQAAKPTQAQAMAACRARYGKKVTDAVVNKNGTLTCRWQVMRARPMTHSEAYEACRKKYGAVTAFVRKYKNGWMCRYKPRY